MPYLPPIIQVEDLTSYWRAVPAGGPVPHDDPSYFDLKIINTPGFDPIVWRDGWCMNPSINVRAFETDFFGEGYSSLEPALIPPGAGSPTYLGGINWLLNQDYTSTNSGYSYGEIQMAIWTLLGFTLNPTRYRGTDLNAHDAINPPVAGSDGTVTPADVSALVSAAQANNAFVPGWNQYVGLVIYPFATDNELFQPMITPVLTARLGDYVWEDLNANGLQDDGPTGIAGVTVKLLRDLNGDGDLLDAGDVLATTTTDANGYYDFQGLMPGLDYTVEFVQPAGYSSVSPYQVGGALAGDNSDGLKSSTVILGEGEWNKTIDSGFYKGTGDSTASLGDYLWVDTNGNGQQDDGPTGISGQTVTLIGGGADGVIGTGSDDTTATTTTDATGHYQFTGLTPGVEYQVEFTTKPSGSVFTTPNVGSDTTDSDASPSTGKTPIVTLAAGVYNNTLDAGVYTPASISGYVYEDVGDDGVRNSEPGIAGTVLTLTGTDGAGNAVTATTTTNASGFYHFTGLAPGNYTVSEAQPSGYADGKDTAGTPGGGNTTVNDKISSITLVSGTNSTENNFGEIVQPPSLGDRLWTDSNGNGIQDSGEPGINGRTVTLIGGGADGLISTTSDNTSATTTTANVAGIDGTYSFTGLTPGVEYQVQFGDIPAGTVFTTPDVSSNGFDATDSDANPATGKTPVVTLASGENNTTLDAGVYTPAAISGYVYQDVGNDGIRNSEPPISGVVLTLTGTTGAGIGVTTTATTDANGFYQFTGLAPGNYTVSEAQPSGYADGKDTAGTPGGGNATVNDVISNITLTSGMTSTENNFGELIAASLGDRLWTDSNGNGIQDSGEPGINGRTVTLIGGGADGLISTTGDNTSATTTTASVAGIDGTYSFTGLTPGVEYQVQFGDIPAGTVFTTPDVSSNGFDATDSDANPADGKTPIVTLAQGDNNTTLDAGVYTPIVIGNYVWKDSNANGVQDGAENGIANVVVVLTGTDGAGNAVTHTTQTDVNGKYEFAEAPGTYQVSIANSNFDPLAPLDGYTASPTGQGTTATDSNATPSATSPVTMPSGSIDQTIDFGYYQPVTVGNYVWQDSNADGIQNDGNTGIGGVTLTLTGFDVNSVAVTDHATTDATGAYNFSEKPGSYTVTIDASNFGSGGALEGAIASPTLQGGNPALDSNPNPSGTTPAALPEGAADPTIDFGYYYPASLGDRVWYDLNGDGIQNDSDPGVQGVVVNLYNSADVLVDTETTDSSGLYLFSSLTPGDYHVGFALNTLPVGYQVTTPHASGSTEFNDSDANPATGVTPVVNLSSGEEDLSVDMGIVALPPGIKIVKDANVTFAAPSAPVTYTYNVSNTGGVALSNVTVIDNSATPGHAADDFNPKPVAGASPWAAYNIGDTNHNNLLDTTETWQYSAIVIPPVTMTVLVNGTTYDSGTLLSGVILDNGDVRVSYRQSQVINDNTYGTGAASDWPSGHTFSQLTGSDKAGFLIKDANGTVVSQFYMDYISLSGTPTATYSGYESLGVTGGDGKMLIGDATKLFDFSSTLQENLNRPGYTTMTTNSPINDPNWDYVDGFSFTIDHTAFGSSSYGGVSIFDQHNSPSKLGVNSLLPDVVPGASTNVATATGIGNGSTVSSTDDATVIIVTGAVGSLGDRVWFDANANGLQDDGANSGIANVKLTLQGDLTGDGTIDFTATTTTDATGAYHFTSLPAATYTVIVDTSTMPSGYKETYDLDGLASANKATTTLTAGQNRSDVDFGYVATTPGFTIDKTANVPFVMVGGAVTYTYVVNSTVTPLSSVVVVDNNGTPSDSSDDFNPTYVSGDSNANSILETTETWTYTAKVIPPVTLQGTPSGGSLMNTGTLLGSVLANGDIRVTYLQSQSVNDNNYLDGKGNPTGWSTPHKIGDLDSDLAHFQVKGANGNVVLDFNMDYITASGTNIDGYSSYSGYESLGVSGGSGNGSITVGSASDLYDFDSTLEVDLNRAGYTGFTKNSPVNDPNWNYTDGYSFTIKASALVAAGGFGSVALLGQTNTVQKVAAFTPAAIGSSSTNTAVASALSGSTPVVASDDATVALVTAVGSLGDRVWFDTNGDAVQDAGEAGIANVVLNLSGDFNNDGTPDYTATTTTDAMGLYSFGNLPAGSYKVSVVSLPGGVTYTETYDLDGTASANVASTTLTAGQNRTNVDFGYVGSTAGFTVEKSADKPFILVGGNNVTNNTVTYTYLVKNTGATTLTDVAVKDNNGTVSTLGITVDDFSPTRGADLVGDGDNLLEAGETWTYTAAVKTPPITLIGTPSGGSQIDTGTLITQVQANGDVRVTYWQMQGVNDNTYGSGKNPDWGAIDHKFTDLTDGDSARFEVKGANGTVLLRFDMDYLSASGSATSSYSGYQSLGLGNDGGVVAGGSLNGSAGTLLTDFSSTLQENLNRVGYTGFTTNSPIGDANWNAFDGYSFTIKAAAFAGTSFGNVSVLSQVNTPQKVGAFTPQVSPSEQSINTVDVTAKLNGAPVAASDTASVFLFAGPLGSLGDRVWLDGNVNGVQDDGATGFTGVKLTLSGDFNNDSIVDYTATTTTGADGAYSFGSLPVGTYTVSVDTSTLPSGFSYLETYDLDGVSSPNVATTTLTAGQVRTDVDFGYVRSTPGFTIDKVANKSFIFAGDQVTYSYAVTTTGATLSSVVVKDDNGTPDYKGDDFMPTYVNGDDGDGLLEAGETWNYTATVRPPIGYQGTISGVSFESGKLLLSDAGGGDIRVTYLQSQNVNDNNYASSGNAPTWNRTHTFNDLVGSDKAGFKVTDGNGNVVLQFYMDYISNSTSQEAGGYDNYANYSNYRSLGVTGGDGSISIGSAANLVDFDSTLELNLNRAGYTAMTSNSPLNDANWNYTDGYSFTIKAAAFGGNGLGTVAITDQHNSPAKVASFTPTVSGGDSTNTVIVSATLSGSTVVATDTATVAIKAEAPASLGDRVWFDTNGNGVQDATEAGIAGVTVTLSGDFNNGGSPVDYTATTTTDASGNYHFGSLPTGSYKVSVNTGTLPAGPTYTQTYDLDGLGSANNATATLTAGQNRTDVDFGYQPTVSGFSVDKTADKTVVANGAAVTYSYDVKNTGTTQLGTPTIKDDNGTPGYAADDFNPTPVLSGGFNSGDTDTDNNLDVGETWHYTATVRPPVTLQGTVNGNTVTAGTLQSQVLSNGDIRVTYLQSQGVNDNTYGTGASSGWTNGHTFSDLTGSDKAGFEVRDGSGAVVLKFYMDYISAAATQDADGSDAYASYSGYRSLGVTGGDGSISTGSAANLVDFDSTLELNLNRAGYTGAIVNSPVGDANWNAVDGYAYTIKAAAFGSNGFGAVSVFDQHNSPSKLGVNSFVPTPTNSSSTNTATVTTTLNGVTVQTSDAQTVQLVVPASIGDRVWCDTNGNGLQDSGELGISGVVVKLMKADGTTELASTTTNSSGNYSFSGLLPDDYRVKVIAPAAFGGFSPKDAGGDTVDSDADSSGLMGVTTLVSGENDTSWDAGLTPPVVTLTYNFSTTPASANDGGDGNIRSYSVGGVTVAAEAFSRKVSDGKWETGWLGAYADGHGVTNRGENGAVSTERVVDNNANGGRIDYVLYQFSDKVVVDSALLSQITTDSDATFWIGNSATTITALSDALLAGMTKEENLGDASSATRTANINAGNLQGNVLVVAASTDAAQQTAKDYFDIKQLTVNAYSKTVTPLAIDLTGNGLQTVALADSVSRFDLLGNGTTVRSGWLAKDDGFLAIDSNHNGKIDSINELFGGGRPGEGFAELIAFDSNGDLVVDASDARFVDLSVWRDSNGNHKTDKGELMSLSQAGVVSLSLDYDADVSFWDAQGNLHLEQSSATLASGQVVDMTDINFAVAANDVGAAAASTLSAGYLFA